MEHFLYGETELFWLCGVDGNLKRLIERIPRPQRKVIPDPFSALVKSIIGQQVSGAAARSILERLENDLGEMTPEAVLGKTDGEMISCGVGWKKTAYIKGIARKAKEGRLGKEFLDSLSDAQVIQNLTALPGVGEWTAEMFLIFCLRRPDVLSYKDLGIRRGIMNLHGLAALTSAQFEQFRKLYSPYGTVASFYLWEAAKNETRASLPERTK